MEAFLIILGIILFLAIIAVVVYYTTWQPRKETISNLWRQVAGDRTQCPCSK